MKATVIGVGNPDRGDDGVGLLVAERFEAPGVEVLKARGEAAELLSLLNGRHTVYLVDAISSGSPPGTVHRLVPPLPASIAAHSTHGLGLAQALELGQVLGTLPAALVVVGIEGGSYTPGAPLSPEALAGADEALRLLRDELLVDQN